MGGGPPSGAVGPSTNETSKLPDTSAALTAVRVNVPIEAFTAAEAATRQLPGSYTTNDAEADPNPAIPTGYDPVGGRPVWSAVSPRTNCMTVEPWGKPPPLTTVEQASISLVI
jgi:hypothetical protein